MTASRTSVTEGWGQCARRIGLAAAVLAAAVAMTLVFPTIRQSRLTDGCEKLGGYLRVSTEDLEPLADGRTVYTCYGPGGHVLDSW